MEPDCPLRQNTRGTTMPNQTETNAPYGGYAPTLASTLAAHEVLLTIIDISGYTRFLVDHRKAQSHAQMIITALLEAMLDRAAECFDVAEIEGDALFVYARDEGAKTPAQAGECLIDLFRIFSAAVRELSAGTVCKCPACANLDHLQIKVIVHHGRAVISRVGSFTKVSGVDVIVAHRLLKNSIDASEYILLTDSAQKHLDFPAQFRFERSNEEYDAIGTVPIHVAKNLECLHDTSDPRYAVGGTSNVGFEILRHEIRNEYAEVASEPDKGFHFHTGRALAERLGYSADDVEWVPETSLAAFAGTGNPFSVGELRPGERVVDIGCGAGFDSLLAARRVGSTGHVIGVDMTDEMLTRARRGVAESDVDNVTILEGYAEDLPIDDGWADVVISNGVFNLCPNKPSVLREMFRVVRPGGRLQIGDILIQKPIPESARKDIDLWTG